MVNIVEAATTISPARRPRSLIIAIVIIGSMFFFPEMDETHYLDFDAPFSGDIVSLAVAVSWGTVIHIAKIESVKD